MFKWIRDAIMAAAAVFVKPSKGSADVLIHTSYSVDTEMAEMFFSEYKSTFSRDLSKYPHDQMNYTREEFLSVCCNSQDVVKQVMMVDGKPAGLCLMVKPEKLHLAPWVSPAFFGDEVYYITVLLVTKEHRKLGLVKYFIRCLMDWLEENTGSVKCGFDMPVEKRFFANLIIRECRSRRINARCVGSQEYFQTG